MGIYTTAIEKLYVAYFNRPADVAGLTFWEGVVAKANGSTAAVSAEFAKSAEYKAAYAGMDEYHVVAQVYQNLFGRAPEPAGLNFWGQALINKAMTIDNVVTQIAAGAQGSDLVAYNNKVAAATAFTAALDTSAEILAYSGDVANGMAKSFISGVTDDASLKAAIADAALNATVQSIVESSPQNVGGVFSLTQGLDTLIGTDRNDTFNAYTFNAVTGADQANLSSFDTIDGGAGKDTLNIFVKDALNADLAGTVKNVEIINIDESAATGPVAVDASKFAGATVINQIGQAGAVTKLGAATTATFTGVSTNISVAAAGASAAVALSGVAEAATVSVSGDSLASATVSGSRVDTDGSGSIAGLNLSVTAGKDVQAVTVTTNQKTTLTVTENAATTTKVITSVDASASTGAITFTSADADILTIKTGSANDTVTISSLTAAATDTAAAKSATLATGAGNDTIVISTGGNGTTSVDAGAGDDGITVNKTAGNTLSVQGGEGNDVITIVGTLSTSDVITGGAGTDTVAMAGAPSRVADDYIVFNKLLTGFETIKFTSAEGALDASKLAANYVTIDLASGSTVDNVGSQAIIARGGLIAEAAGYAYDAAGSTYAGTLNITERSTGTISAGADAVALTVKASTTATTATLVGDVQTAIVTLTNSVNATSNATADTIATVIVDNTADNGSMSSLTLTGNGSATVINAAGTALTTVDASALGGTYTLGANTGAAINGLTYTSSNTKVETIKLGAGVDTITLNASTYGKADIVSGLHLVANSAGTALAAGSDVLHITGATGAAKFTTAQTDLDLALKDAAVSTKGDTLVFTLGGDTYVYHDGGTAGVVDSADIVVKLVGTIDLDALVLSLGPTV